MKKSIFHHSFKLKKMKYELRNKESGYTSVIDEEGKKKIESNPTLRKRFQITPLSSAPEPVEAKKIASDVTAKK